MIEIVEVLARHPNTVQSAFDFRYEGGGKAMMFPGQAVAVIQVDGRSGQAIEPDPKLINSMCMRYRHDFWLLPQPEQEMYRRTMRQLWEEVVGLGFYQPGK